MAWAFIFWMSNLYNRLLMPCLCMAAVCQAMRRIREISCTWKRKQGLPLGHWLGHKHPFNRLTPHFAPKAGWRVPRGRETEHTDGGEVEVSSWKAAAEKNRHLISQAFPSRRGPSRTMQRFFPFRNNRGIMSEPSLVRRGKNTLCCLRWPDQTLYLSQTEIIDLVIRMKAD